MSLNIGYAVALFDLASKENKQKIYHDATRLVLEVLTQNDELIKILSSTRLGKEQKKEIIETTFKNDVPEFLLNALFLMVDNGAFNVAIDNFKALNKMFNDHFNIVQGTIYTTIKLSKDEIEKITILMEKKVGKTVELENKIDNQIIGGIKVVIGDKVFDMSITSQIEEITTKLMKGVN